MTVVRLVLVLACAMVLPGFVQAGPLDPPKPEAFIRAEDQERARLLNIPCAEADVGRGCYRLNDHLWREAPCSYRIDAGTVGFLPTDQCYKMDKPRRYRGIWFNEFESQAFVPEGTTAPEWPRTDRRSPGWKSSGWRKQFERAQAESIWLDVERVALRQNIKNSGRKMLIDFTGRETSFPGHYGHMGMSGREIIVDRVISLKKIE